MRDKIVSVRMTREQHQKLVKLAEGQNKKVSEVVLDKLFTEPAPQIEWVQIPSTTTATYPTTATMTTTYVPNTNIWNNTAGGNYAS